ncbi:DUF5688 family protein [Butyrivibrio sp. LC3010]|uniref:DUF5688 family protein n=1 Tax=Butyrivibrio sp. LC3010 TaxID=1280680 RepID=UPI0004070F60|nr:DUF5688 family protein [Butyrivibrio sp. LC3010]
MDYERFKEGFQDALKAELAVRGADVELTARRVDKMNGSYDAITVRPTESSIGVNISIEKAFASYENGTPIPEIAEHFADAVEKGFRESPQVDLESLSDYEQMKSKLSMEVVSAEKNAELLESVPHERMEDMAVVYRFVLDQTDSGNGTILVTNQLLDQYGITKEQLRADAMENAPEIRPSEIRGMSEVMSELAPGMIPEVAPEDEQMFVATVPDKIHGAGVIAYPNFMEDAAQKMGGDFFVLPSSIHEVLLVKDNGQMTAKELENMVKEVNATQVEPADQLTDHVYHYDSQNHIFELADKYEERQREAEHEAVDKDSVLGDLKEKKQEIAKKDPAKDAATKATTKKHETSL